MTCYLDEGFDIDEDGAYIERSVGIYDTVTNNALLLYAMNGEREDKKQEAFGAVKKPHLQPLPHPRGRHGRNGFINPPGPRGRAGCY